jgi:hypothetical protein
MARTPDLQLHEDMPHQRREWFAERAGWVVMAVLLAASLTGVLGTGPLSEQTADGGDGFKVEYERFARYQAPSKIVVHFPAQGDEARIGLSRDFYEAMEIEVEPQPNSVELTPEDVIFHFGAQPQGGSSAVTFRVKPDERWEREATITLNGSRHVTFRMFVFP